MKFLPIALGLFLLIMELSIAGWRNGVAVSSAPVFTLPMVKEAMKAPGKFQRSIDVYHANRGAEVKTNAPEGEAITLFYFEWDHVDAAPMMDLCGHAPEQCNVPAGFDLIAKLPGRTFDSPGHDRLLFDSTLFKDHGGRPVHVFKMAWIQGLGSWDIRQGEKRSLRFSRSFVRGSGAARVIECGITGATGEDQAWQIFTDQILKNAVWSDPSS